MSFLDGQIKLPGSLDQLPAKSGLVTLGSYTQNV